MKKNIEKEVKFVLTKDDYECLFEYLSLNYIKQETIIQANYYLETSDYSLKKQKISSRIRSINDREFEFTIKIKLNKDRNISVKDEFNFKLTKEEFEYIMDNGITPNNNTYLKPLLEHNIIINNIDVIGSLKTERTFFEIDNYTKPINLDKCNYLEEEDYEVEWEIDDVFTAKNVLNEIFKILNIVPLNIYSSKNERFQEELYKTKPIN